MKHTIIPGCAMVATAITVFSIQSTLASPAASAAPDRAEFPSVHLAATVSGREAVTALGNQLPAIARAYGTSAQELATRLQLDRTLHVDRGGRLLYACNAPKATVTTIGSSGAATAATPAALSDTFVLHSRPGATKVIYLDFVGFTTSGTIWNSGFHAGADFVTPPYDIDGNPSAFSDTELARIQGIWERVAEDYSPFDVDVTTEDPGVEALRKTSSTDANYGIRVCIGGSCYDWYGASAGGVSFVGAFNWSSDTPNYVFTAQLGNGDEKYTAEAVSHEVGHTLGLSHDGVLPSTAYYSGQGSGATGWAPIMGVGYYEPVVQWSKGEYANANNTQDDLAIIASYVGYRADDHGDTAATATYLPTSAQISATGVIGSQSDVDVVAFTTGAGTVSLTLGGDLRSPNLDLAAELRDAAGNVVATSNPAAGLGATLGATVPAGTYFVFVHGAACGDPLTTGYSAYGSIGQWGLKGTVIDPNGGVAPVAVATASATTGVAPATIVFNGAGSFDQDGFLTGYLWTFSDGTSAGGATVSKCFAAAGTYTATVTVTDNSGLTGSSSVAVNIGAPNQAPVCIASVSASSGYAPLAITFLAGGSYDADGTIAGYYWNFGDGTASTAANVSKSYTAAGNYTATVTVTDNQGLSASRIFPITVSVDTTTKTLRVQSVAVSVVSTRGQAVVKIANPAGTAVSGVSVVGSWSGIIAGTSSGTTDSTGTVILQTSTLKKTGALGFTVTGVGKNGYAYSPALNVQSSGTLQVGAAAIAH